MKTQRTPTPWNINKNNYCRIEVPKINTDDTFEIATLYNAANAAHIVKCVNLHDELVELIELTLQDIKSGELEPYNEKNIISKIQDLLKRVNGDA